MASLSDHNAGDQIYYEEAVQPNLNRRSRGIYKRSCCTKRKFFSENKNQFCNISGCLYTHY